MKNIKVLDCTLRDGGYINDWKFGRDVIAGIIGELSNACIDIIECGFIRDVAHDPDSSVYSDMGQLAGVIHPKQKNILYAVMIEQHNYKAGLICPCSEDTADIIRLTFRKTEWSEAKQTAIELIDKGYKVCIQPVGTASYDDASLIKLIGEVNEISPYAFYLVDTLGVMYRHEMRKFFYLIDNNLSNNIALGFHSHNNLQMSFSNAQEMIRLNRDRNILIDSSCYGMGRGVGNLATELITDYINNNIEQRYSIIPILNIVDKYLMPVYDRQRWGYDLPYFLSATAKCHPNYAAHLMRKETLSVEKIEKMISLIPKDKRDEYDPALIEDLYLRMQDCNVDDRGSYEELTSFIGGREAIIIGPGASIIKHRSAIEQLKSDRVAISANFIPDDMDVDALFISNYKRLSSNSFDNSCKVLATSNLTNEIDAALLFDYSSLLGEGDASDNAGAMLIRILKKAGVKKIYLAGFDGFDVDSSSNYAVSSFKKTMDYDTAKKKNEDISKQLTLALNGVNYEFITPTKYKISDL
ncbi:aldolase catalytic domain-containing protein [uncultured Ruminococcus sp.]|uniref:aldolase catalytic domain-containing protein n=1 Tax=uncultured Ruminococcus sp. TaxID=165186 RepID=UPI0025F7FEE8|nr:aldolase catalytic domain-containing protein [uncultured Ruminococcus sp.]